jgi:formylmethanofuran dehydrogenase subunit E
MPDSVLFRVQDVKVKIDACDLPGPTRYKVPCSRCGQVVRDQREVVQDGAVLCRPCAQEAYFSDAREVTWPDMNWKPGGSLTQTRTDAKMTETNCY